MKKFQIEQLEERIAPARGGVASEAIQAAYCSQGDDGGLANALSHANPNSAVHRALSDFDCDEA